MRALRLDKVLLLPWRPQIQMTRNSNRINIQRPKPPHFERAKLIAVCKPTYPKPLPVICYKNVPNPRIKVVEVDNSFERILAKELLNWLNNSKFVAFFHMNPVNAEESFKTSILLRRQGLTLKVYGKAVVKRAVASTHYEPVLQLFHSRSAMAFSETTECIPKLLKVLRRIPHLVLMAGILENRLMSRAELDWYAALPSLTMARVQLVSLLAGSSGPAAHLVSQLSAHQQGLVARLDQRSQQLSAEDPAACSEKSE